MVCCVTFHYGLVWKSFLMTHDFLCLLDSEAFREKSQIPVWRSELGATCHPSKGATTAAAAEKMRNTGITVISEWLEKTGKKSHQHITARPAFTVSVRLCINVKTVIGSFTLRQYLIAARDLDTHRQSGGKCWNRVIPSGTSPEIWHLTVRV